jgi:hypothetical protein
LNEISIISAAERTTAAQAVVEGMTMLELDDDEAGYLRWVKTNPGGFVINAPKRRGAEQDMLHRASCVFITTPKHTNYTTTSYKKVCSPDRKELVDWGASYSSTFRLCKHCKP